MSARGADRPIDAFADMPLTLKGITSFFAVFGAGSLALPLVPGLEHRVAGEVLSTGELWARGLGPFALGLGVWLGVTALGLLRRAPRARWGVVWAWLPLVLAELWLADSPRLAWQGTLAAAWAAGTAVHLFRGAGTARYFSRSTGP